MTAGPEIAAMEARAKVWDQRFLSLADHIREWSKDPSTQVGCVVVNDDRRVIAMGYNGFPKGVVDDPALLEDREAKYARVVHAELNAILNSVGPVTDCTLYVYPLQPCAECAKAIIQSGIIRVVYPPQAALGRWSESQELAVAMMEEAGLEVTTP